jgi:hypothetical protein
MRLLVGLAEIWKGIVVLVDSFISRVQSCPKVFRESTHLHILFDFLP